MENHPTHPEKSRPHRPPRNRRSRGFITAQSLLGSRFDAPSFDRATFIPAHLAWTFLFAVATLASGYKAFTRPTMSAAWWDLAFIASALLFLVGLVHLIWLQARREIRTERIRHEHAEQHARDDR